MVDYEMEDHVYEINYEGRVFFVTRLVVGAIDPTNRTGSISPSVEDPLVRNVTYN